MHKPTQSSESKNPEKQTAHQQILKSLNSAQENSNNTQPQFDPNNEKMQSIMKYIQNYQPPSPLPVREQSQKATDSVPHEKTSQTGPNKSGVREMRN